MKGEKTFVDKIEKMSVEEINQRQKDIMKEKLPEIKPVAFVVEGSLTKIQYEYPELIGLCPMTGYPDTYTLRVKYIPNKHIPELKSLRFYFMSFMKMPIFHEHLINKVFIDFCILHQRIFNIINSIFC